VVLHGILALMGTRAGYCNQLANYSRLADQREREKERKRERERERERESTAKELNDDIRKEKNANWIHDVTARQCQLHADRCGQKKCCRDTFREDILKTMCDIRGGSQQLTSSFSRCKH
jgi:hypothetical protein